jgi:adenylate kinase family enzyme
MDKKTPKEVYQLIKIIRSNGQLISESNYNKLIERALHKNKIESSYIIIEFMKKDGFAPDISLYTQLLSLGLRNYA